MSSRNETRSLVVDGVPTRVHVRRGGDASGVPLVLANGIGASVELLQPFVDALPADIEVVRFEVPGIGGSAAARWPYRMPALARRLRQTLDLLDYGPVDLLGVSWGGGLAQQVALTRREPLSKAGARQHRHGIVDGARLAARPAVDVDATPLPGPGVRQAHRRENLRRSDP